MWMAFAGTEPLQDSISECDPGEVMLWLMKNLPEDVHRDYLDWLRMRETRGETAVRALFNPVIADALKEEYLDFVTACAMETGYYSLGNGLTIKNIEDTEGEDTEGEE